MQSTRHRLLVGVTAGVVATLILVSVSKSIQDHSNIDNLISGQIADSIVQPGKKQYAETQLYADASSPLYLEPYRHEDTDHVAWKWAADVRSRKPANKSPTATAAKKSPTPTETVAESAPQDETLKLAQLDAATLNPCPWYGCADGSHADFSEHVTAPQAFKKATVSHNSVKAGLKPKEKTTIKTITKNQGGEKQQKLLAHGHGTSDTFTAKPLSVEKNQFYGGSSKFYGSTRPVTSRAGFVDGSQAYSVDMAPAHDLGDATSFDSLPLASPSSPESRIALAQPAGDGSLAQNLFRYMLYGHA
jgi:hypothetical protein